MRDLHEMNIGQRAIVTVVIVVVILLVLALIGYLSGRWEEAQAQTIAPSKWDSRMIELDKQALDRAYVAQVGHVFDIWIKDGVADPSRATRGFANARKGYNAAMIEIERREKLQPGR
jgi:hypothetical protein